MTQIKGFQDTINWYNANAGKYAASARNISSSAEMEKFTSFIPTSSKVLDAGCGPGRDSRILKDKGYDVTGVDISEGLLNEAKKEYKDIEFVLGNLLSLPFPAKTFDGVWSQASLVHLETPEDTQKAIQEFYRVLKTDGIVYLSVKELTGNQKTAVVSDTLSNHDRFFQYYTKEEITKMLETAGFEVLFIENNVPDPAGRPETKWVWAIGKK